MDSVGKLADGSWGLLASSSSRLAHDLLIYTFDTLIAASYCSLERIEPSHTVCDPPTTPPRNEIVSQYSTPQQSPPKTIPPTPAAYYTPPSEAKVMDVPVQYEWEEMKCSQQTSRSVLIPDNPPEAEENLSQLTENLLEELD